MAEPLWTLGEIAKAARGTTLGAAATPVLGCSIDSRSLAPGDAFVAIRGPNRDGHAFVAAALVPTPNSLKCSSRECAEFGANIDARSRCVSGTVDLLGACGAG